MGKRYKIRFKKADDYRAALAAEAAPFQHTLECEERCFVVVELKRETMRTTTPSESAAAMTLEAILEESMSTLAREYGADLVEDYQYELDGEALFDFDTEEPDTANPSLEDVITKIRADAAWKCTRGEGVTIAIVDTGVDGNRPEFPASKQVGDWTAPGDTAWTDWKGHGSMCACIAAGTKANGGVFDGVAPDAGVIACKTHFYDSELSLIYDYLTSRAKTGERIIASNSFGRKTGTPPAPPQQSDFIDAMNDAIAAGIVVCFSAGNNHQRVGGSPTACDPNSVWLHKSRDDIFAVATCDLQDQMWYYSSRGPGQHYGDPGTSEKPDVTAPTPRNGRVVYGSTVRSLPNGWGTSGACPQAAGLAALLVSKNASLDRNQIFAAIAGTATNVGLGHTCQGTGVIDCAAAVASV